MYSLARNIFPVLWLAVGAFPGLWLVYDTFVWYYNFVTELSG